MEYIYDITAFPGSKCYTPALNQEIVKSTISTALDYINGYPGSVSIFFKGTLSNPDVSTLDNIVATHSDSYPLPPEPEIFPPNLQYQGIGSDITFGTPRTTGLPDFSKIFTATQIQVLGTKGPDLSNWLDFGVTYDSVLNNINTLYFDTTNGVPAYFVNMIPDISSHHFGSPSPDITLLGTGVANLDGDYWANVIDNSSFVLASKTGNFTLLFKNSSTGYIPIQYNTNFALLDVSNRMYNSNIPANLFGSQFNFVYDASESTTTNTAFQTKSILTVKNLPIGTYRVSVSYVGSGSSTSYQFESRVLINTVQEGGTHILRVSNTANYDPATRTFMKVLSGNTTIQLQWRTNNALGTARIRDAVIELWRVN
jgi:hypothetical protein